MENELEVFAWNLAHVSAPWLLAAVTITAVNIFIPIGG